VMSTLWEFMACSNKGSIRQMLAFSSSGYLAANQTMFLTDDFNALITRPATPMAAGEQFALVAIWDVRDLEDGRIGALVAFTGLYPETTLTRYVYFVREDGQLRFDSFIEKSELVDMGIDISIPADASTPVAG
jgi:hypothetical protein